MTSPAYEVFLSAMRQRRPVRCTYQGKPRILCPVILGHTDGREKALTYQTGGTSSRPLADPKSRWRCLFIDDVANAELHDGAWHTGDNHSASQTCVAVVDYDVNPDSPYRPRFRP